MAREEFINNLRHASRMLLPARAETGQGPRIDSRVSAVLDSADLWLTSGSVSGFNRDDFASLPESDLSQLETDLSEFLNIAAKVVGGPAPKRFSEKARRHLESVFRTVRQPILAEWLTAQQQLLHEAEMTARSKGWFVEADEKEITESLLGRYRSPRLRIRSLEFEVVFDPIARFGNNGKGLVDLLTLPTYETAYYLSWKKNAWWIVSATSRVARERRFCSQAFANAISNLSKV